ncbi:class I SAM-dependent methyltransferase [Vibrio sp. SCSIO 43136]|uniref:class I SAM-dependent methyltransferase n=1 Tax=Vibrio sp. SCSIO 43136 TaxID=2819101 RepID=UPI00207501AE|nr:class I SAM-dependent methyltransferase [Vibrio sp. SCSIO 43136]USD64031.1 class I SAM-dependent methyltransferase [Vibrio sp. SCSIO 43136]
MSQQPPWDAFYEKAKSRRHNPKTEQALKHNQSHYQVAIDAGCGVGADTRYLLTQGYSVHAFDNNDKAISMCSELTPESPFIEFTLASFEHFDYPSCGVFVANSSLFFADQQHFESLWQKITDSIVSGGVFAGDFLGETDSWVVNGRSDVMGKTRRELETYLAGFEIIEWQESAKQGMTLVGHPKYWHTHSIIARKR